MRNFMHEIKHPILPCSNIINVDTKTVNKYGLSWIMPKNVKPVEMVFQDQIFNFILDCGHCINVNNHWCCTLGHDLKGDGIEHPLWGNSKAIKQFLKNRSKTGYPNVVY